MDIGLLLSRCFFVTPSVVAVNMGMILVFALLRSCLWMPKSFVNQTKLLNLGQNKTWPKFPREKSFKSVN